jgi:anti-sigma B factor antagonist
MLTAVSAVKDPERVRVPLWTLTVDPGSYRVARREREDERVSCGVIPGSSGFPVRWLGGFAVVELPAGKGFLTAPALAGELCAVLDAGAAGLVVELPGAGVCESACLDALMRAARRARGWGSWLRLVIPDPGARKVVRLVALGEVMPVHASVTGAVAAAAWEAAMVAAGGG